MRSTTRAAKAQLEALQPSPVNTAQSHITQNPYFTAGRPLLSQWKNKICAREEGKCLALAPKIMMPAAGAVPKWRHRHSGIMSGPPASGNFSNPPSSLSPNDPPTPSQRQQKDFGKGQNLENVQMPLNSPKNSDFRALGGAMAWATWA